MEDRFIVPAMQIPPAGEIPELVNGKNTLLIVLLTVLSEPEKAKLIQHHQRALPHVMIQTWAPSRTLLQFIVKQGPHKDSQGNIYALAVQLYNAGVARFVVADELTKRQLTGHLRLGESSKITVVKMDVQPERLITYQDAGEQEDASEAVTQDAIDVLAERTDFGEMEDRDSTQSLETLDHTRQKPKPLEGGEFETWIDASGGLRLHDPDRGCLTADTATSLTQVQYLEGLVPALRSKNLPTELVMKVISFADSALPCQMKLREYQHGPRCLQLFLFFPTSSAELHNTKSIIEHALHRDSQGHVDSVELIPVDRHGISSRREFMTFLREYSRTHPDEGKDFISLIFLLAPIQEDISLAQFGFCFGHRDRPTVITRATYKDIIRRVLTNHDTHILLSHWMRSLQASECLIHPDRPLYADPPLWLPVDFCLDRPCEVLSAFYLTRHLTGEQDQAIRTELMSEREADQRVGLRKEACYVPWKREDDGTLSDIWNILWKCFDYEGLQRFCPSFVCIDRQSGIDQTVLFVAPDWEFYETRAAEENAKELLKGFLGWRLQGFGYTRLSGREAHAMNRRVDEGRLGIEPTEDSHEIMRFPRPDFP